jgi:hypothetical protein
MISAREMGRVHELLFTISTVQAGLFAEFVYTELL